MTKNQIIFKKITNVMDEEYIQVTFFNKGDWEFSLAKTRYNRKDSYNISFFTVLLNCKDQIPLLRTVMECILHLNATKNSARISVRNLFYIYSE